MAALTFTALLHEDGTLDVEPGFVVDAEPTRGDGAVEVVALGRRSRPLARTRLPVLPICAAPVPGSAGEPVGSLVAGIVAFPAGATGLAVTLDGQQVWQRQAPGVPLEVRLDWPATVGRDRLELSWEASTSDCSAVLAYSADGGDTWLPLSVPSAAQPIIADLTHVAGGAGCLLELLVTDGFSSQRLRSQPYELEPAGWRVWVLAPADGDTLEAGAVTILAGQAFHVEEKRDSPEVSWSSSIDGALGVGARLPVSLSPGRHLLTATASGASATVTVESQ